MRCDAHSTSRFRETTDLESPDFRRDREAEPPFGPVAERCRGNPEPIWPRV